jgi:TonB family protein
MMRVRGDLVKLVLALLLVPAAAFAQGGQIVSAPVNPPGEIQVINLRVVDESRCLDRMVRLTSATSGQNDRDRFAAGGAAQREILMKFYLQMHEDLQATANPSKCAAIDPASQGFIALADMAAFLQTTKAEIAKLDTQIADLEKKIGGAAGETLAGLERIRADLVSERTRLQGLTPRKGLVQLSTSAVRGQQGGGNPGTAAEPLSVAGNILDANCLSCPFPPYPNLARNPQVPDTVLVQVVVARDGSVKDARVIRGNTLFQAAAVEAVRAWRFKPMAFEGNSTEVIGTVSVQTASK